MLVLSTTPTNERAVTNLNLEIEGGKITSRSKRCW